VPHFRISLGSTTVESARSKGALEAAICDLIADKIHAFKKMKFAELKNLSAENAVEYTIQNKKVQVTFYKKDLGDEHVLLVVQAAYKTFKFPNYFSFGFVGRIIVEGIQGSAQEEFSKPKESLLWEFT